MYSRWHQPSDVSIGCAAVVQGFVYCVKPFMSIISTNLQSSADFLLYLALQNTLLHRQVKGQDYSTTLDTHNFK